VCEAEGKKQDAEGHVLKAGEMIEKTGYLRRKEEAKKKKKR
jgi:hypothetical protein